MNFELSGLFIDKVVTLQSQKVWSKRYKCIGITYVLISVMATTLTITVNATQKHAKPV